MREFKGRVGSFYSFPVARYARITRRTSPVEEVILCRPGQIIECAEPTTVFIFDVPDPAHQSSLDYLAGI